MGRIIRRIINDFNIKKQANELGVSVWKAPSVLFILMGVIIIAAMTAIYLISHNNYSPEILIFSEIAVVLVLFTIGSFIIKSIEEMAIANKMKSEFISITSHQLKTPLTEINWEIEFLLSQYSNLLNQEQKDIIKTITNSTAKIIKLVNDLLDVVRIEQGRFILAKEKMNIMKTIEEAIEENKFFAKSNNTEIKFIKTDFIPEIIADRKRIKTVIDNFISNAIKYIKSKGHIEVSVDVKNSEIIVCVKDNGIGIPKSQHRIIFQKFFRSDNAAKYQTEGTGLGLYISKNIVDQSGGKIWFKSIEGEGSSFYFSLPIEQSSK